jgi:hypothetical protein
MNKKQLEEHERKHEEAMHKFLLANRESLPPKALQFVINPVYENEKKKGTPCNN